MKTQGILLKLPVILALALSAFFFSCDMFQDVKNDIVVTIQCSGGTSLLVKNQFTGSIIADTDYTYYLPTITPATNPDPNGGDGALFMSGAADIETLTVTATKLDETSTLTIMVYKNWEFADKGYATLPSCTTTGTTSCTNSITFTWKLNTENDTTKSTSGSSSSSSSSTSSSSSSSSSSGS
jgi:hypothetical protein